VNKIGNKSAEEQIREFGFTLSEVEHLGIAALNKFNSMYGVNIMSFEVGDMKRLYRDVIEEPGKYKPFVQWLKPRFDLFCIYEFPLRIYVGGEKQFIQRGDEKLEKSLKKVSKALEDYVDFDYITPNRISAILYYINLIV
jgi:hypothetical protein